MTQHSCVRILQPWQAPRTSPYLAAKLIDKASVASECLSHFARACLPRLKNVHIFATSFAYSVCNLFKQLKP